MNKSGRSAPTLRYYPVPIDVPCGTCADLIQAFDLKNGNSWMNRTWHVERIVRNKSCRLCSVLCWMYKSTPRHQIFMDGVATSTVVWYGPDRSELGLSLEFSHGIKGRGLTGYPYDCPYTLYPVLSGCLGRWIHDLSFDHLLVRHSWLHSCDSSHNCLSAGGSKIHSIHTHLRMIDIKNWCVVQAPYPCRYAALSYVWGKVDQPVLLKSNVCSFEKPGHLAHEQIPQTIKDAIRICYLLQLEYLWVDSLCSVQDSEFQIGRQIAHMHEIYNSAYLTIIVGTGDDCNSGIFSSQINDHLQHTANIGDASFVAALGFLEPLEERLYASAWHRRAWTMQEYTLSRRSLIFTSHEYFMYCGQGVYIPTLKEPLSSRYSFGKSLLSHRLSIEPPRGMVGRRYAQLVSLYVRRELSYHNDILRAFEGMANYLAPHLGRFCAGLPQDSFRWSLCWMNFGPVRRRSGFPSWSWAGWIHPAMHSTTNDLRKKGILRFPEFDFSGMWPRCLMYRWSSPTLMHLLRSRHILPQGYPNGIHYKEPEPRIEQEHLKWMVDVPELESDTSSAYEVLFKDRDPAFHHFRDISIENIITFKSCKVVLGTSRYCKHSEGMNAWTSLTLTAIPYLELPIPHIDHNFAYHENPAIEYEHHTYIFVGHTDRTTFDVVALPVVIDFELPGLGYGPHGMPDEVVARRAGNPRRIHHSIWFERARRCIVHLW